MGTLAEWTIVLLIIAMAVLWALAYRQWRIAAVVARAQLYQNLYRTMYTDPSIRQIFYTIEYGRFKFDADFAGSETEKLVDRLLSFADLVCDLFVQGAITRQQLAVFQYEFLRIYGNPDIKAYLDTLSRFHGEMRTGTKPFSSFIAFCERTTVRLSTSTAWQPFPELNADTPPNRKRTLGTD